MLLAAATSSQVLNVPVLQLPCPVSCTCCEGPTGPTSGTRRILFVATSKTTPMAFFSACSSCNIATDRSESMIKVQQQREAYLVRDPKRSMVAGAAATTRVVNHYRRCGDSRGPSLSPWLLAWLPPRCRLNDGGIPVTYLTDQTPDKFLTSTSYIEQIPGGASLTRDVVSMPQPPIGVHMLRANSALGA